MSEIIAGSPDRFFDYFKIRYRAGQNKIYQKCPIHCSNNPSSLNIYLNGYSLPFFWKCRTKHCDLVFKSSLVGFARGMLSSKQGWRREGDQTIGFFPTIQFLCKLYQIDIDNIKENPQDVDNQLFIAQTKPLGRENKGCDQKTVRSCLEIPSKYYQERGYSSEILDKYDVGFCNDPARKMFGRVVVPVYEEEGKVCIGATGRSIYKQCGKCKKYHEDNNSCPTSDIGYSKWHHSFDSSSSLYNYWFSKNSIRSTETAIIVESPGNVWRLEEAGFHNSVATYGTNLTLQQQHLLEKASCMTLVLSFDNDESGRHAMERVAMDCSKYYNIRKITAIKNDLGEMNVNEVKKLFNNGGING